MRYTSNGARAYIPSEHSLANLSGRIEVAARCQSRAQRSLLGLTVPANPDCDTDSHARSQFGRAAWPNYPWRSLGQYTGPGTTDLEEEILFAPLALSKGEWSTCSFGRPCGETAEAGLALKAHESSFRLARPRISPDYPV